MQPPAKFEGTIGELRTRALPVLFRGGSMHLGWVLRDALHNRATYFCFAFVRGKKWRPTSLDIKDHTRYEQYLKKWQRRRSKQQLWSLADGALGNEVQEKFRPTAPRFNANADCFFHDSFEDDISQQRRQTFANSRDTAMREHEFRKHRTRFSPIQEQWYNVYEEDWEESDTHQDPREKRTNGSKSPGQPAAEGMWGHLRVLGLPYDAKLTARRLKEAFHLCARKWHPDLHQGSDKSAAEVRFKEAHAAYQNLMLRFSK